MTPQKHREFLAAMQRSGAKAVILQLDIATVFQLVSMLQLALRHPAASEAGAPSAVARCFIDDFRAELAEREPVLAELVAIGDQPEHDVECTPPPFVEHTPDGDVVAHQGNASDEQAWLLLGLKEQQAHRADAAQIGDS